MAVNKTQLITAFSQFIDTCDLATADEEKAIDLYTLFAELAALKVAVKQDARQTRRALDEFKQLFESLAANNTHLQSLLSEIRQAKVAQQDKLLRPLLLDLIEIHDRLINNIAHLPGNQILKRRKLWHRSCQKPADHSLEALSLLVKHIEQRLADHQVSMIQTIGKILNPVWMQVVSTEQDPNKANNIVIQEFRRGYLWEDEVLRYAEVSINKNEVKNEGNDYRH